MDFLGSFVLIIRQNGVAFDHDALACLAGDGTRSRGLRRNDGIARDGGRALEGGRDFDGRRAVGANGVAGQGNARAALDADGNG